MAREALGFVELRALDEIANELHTSLDRDTLGIQHQVVKQGVFPVDTERCSQGAPVGGVVAFEPQPVQASYTKAYPVVVTAWTASVVPLSSW